jgi:hypothetical protein
MSNHAAINEVAKDTSENYKYIKNRVRMAKIEQHMVDSVAKLLTKEGYSDQEVATMFQDGTLTKEAVEKLYTQNIGNIDESSFND